MAGTALVSNDRGVLKVQDLECASGLRAAPGVGEAGGVGGVNRMGVPGRDDI